MHQRGTDASSLLPRLDTDRSDAESWGGIDVSTGGQNVPDDLVIFDGDERELGDPRGIVPKP